MKVLFLSALMLVVGKKAYAQTYNLDCEAIGYAYSYDKEAFYQSRKVSFNYKTNNSCSLGGHRAHIENEWHSFFKSEVREYYEYTIGVKSDCECNGDAPSGVSRDLQDFKSDFVRKGFYMNRLRGFHPEDSTF